jgi:hypothetical protein
MLRIREETTKWHLNRERGSSASMADCCELDGSWRIEVPRYLQQVHHRLITAVRIDSPLHLHHLSCPPAVIMNLK